MFIREIWGKFTSFIFWNFKKVNRLNLSQISSLNIRLIPIFPIKHMITSTKIE